MNQTPEQLKKMTKELALDEIRAILAFDEAVRDSIRTGDTIKIKPGDDAKQHYRFRMSGYEGAPGSCTVQNLFVLNKFAFLGIYDYTEFLTIDFYKGNGTLYFKYWNQYEVHEVELTSLGTCEIIYKIFELTIFTDKQKRRR
jgi:hypothetical protein